MSARDDYPTPTPISDGPCMACGGPNTVVWFTDNHVWNQVLDPGSMEDPGGFLCIPCFVALAETQFYPTGWRLIPEFPFRERSVDPTLEAMQRLYHAVTNAEIDRRGDVFPSPDDDGHADADSLLEALRQIAAVPLGGV